MSEDDHGHENDRAHGRGHKHGHKHGREHGRGPEGLNSRPPRAEEENQPTGREAHEPAATDRHAHAGWPEPRDPCADRKRVQITTVLPWTFIGQLIVTFPSSQIAYCTATLLDERHILTAAHNLYNPRLGVWALNVGFQAARDGSVEHYPSVAGLPEPSKVIPADVKEGIVRYYESYDPELRDYPEIPPLDYCVLELSNVVLPQADWLDIGAPTDQELFAATAPGGKALNVTGYPGEMYTVSPGHRRDVPPTDTPLGTMWGQSGPLTDSFPEQLVYGICATGGQSGAPILMNLSGDAHDWVIVGIHLFRGLRWNSGLRLTDEMVQDILYRAGHVKVRRTPMTKCKDLNTSVQIDNVPPFTGTYTTHNKTTDASYSYYGSGVPNDTHFTVAPTGNGEGPFETFHITVDITGSNVAIWYDRGNFSNVNTNNLPPSKLAEWDQLWAENEDKYNAMAQQFWNKVQ